MAIFKETKRSRADAPDRSEPPDLENVHDHELGHSAQPPARKKPRRDPPADAVGTAAASPIITSKKRSPRPNNRPAGSGGAPKPSRCVGILSALLREGVSQPTWILQKELSGSDVSSQQSRLLLTHKQVTATTSLRDLITSDEAALVADRERGLPVRVFDRLGREHAMTFKFLDSNGDFRLIGSWGRFVKRHGLRAGDRIDIWAFRCCGGLGMALLSRKKGDEVREDGDDDKFDADELLAAEALLLLQDS
ncbi:B3 domain-containing protein At1g05920-like [Ananas comosus]|uniref:B3 domain-containing protein At1g05920-like n=1 Tax=Ananas comosus TaxID=4615 RepID=A0A6P5FN90_ANACO|nr:B3 domain-containing protein At1g05920-like [Ananas comosus]